MSIYLAPEIVLDATLADALAWPVFLWENLVTFDGITADSEDADYPATNLANPQTSSLWKSTSTAAQNLLFDVDPDRPIDSVGIARHNFGSAGIGVQVYGITADIGAVFVLLADLYPGDDSPVLAIFAADYYVKIKITLTPAAVAPQAAVAFIGSLLYMPTGIPPGHIPLFDAQDVTMLTGVAENGDFLGDIIVSQQLGTDVQFQNIDGDWYRNNMRAFVQSRAPFFFAWAPTLYPTETGFAKFNGNPKPTITQPIGLIGITLPLLGLAL